MRTWKLKSEVEGGDFIGIGKGWGGNHTRFFGIYYSIINSLSLFLSQKEKKKKIKFPFISPFPSLCVIGRDSPMRGFLSFSPQLFPSISLSLSNSPLSHPFLAPPRAGHGSPAPSRARATREGRAPWSRGQAARRRRGGAAGGDGAAQRTTIDREGEGDQLVFVPLLVLWKFWNFFEF